MPIKISKRKILNFSILMGCFSFFVFTVLFLSSCLRLGGAPSNGGGSSLVSSSPLTFEFTPASGAVGTLITLTGADFSTVQSMSVGGRTGIIITQSSTSLVALVAPETSSGLVTVTTLAGSSLTSSDTFSISSTGAPSAQQGVKLSGAGAVGRSHSGYSLALSANGSTALIGGYSDNTSEGAAWVFTRSDSTWTQQGSKLVGSGAVGAANQGYSVALSADGNTALVGGITDDSQLGAAWVFIRSGTTWTQQGPKLVGSGGDAIGGAIYQGNSVALSADGNTALIGGMNDGSLVGAAWVFTRSGSTWIQQGSKLVGSGAVGMARQGSSVALSADGNTALVGGYTDEANKGAAWVFTRSGSTWNQQGSKLRGSGAVGSALQGVSVALSADGNTALIGGNLDDTNVGAAWVFTRSGSTWTQQGSKLVGSGAVLAATQGVSVALSADGNTALIGGEWDDNGVGAAWVFARSDTTWTQHGSKLIGTAWDSGYEEVRQGSSVALSADGNTALIGGGNDYPDGAAWVFVAP